MLQGFIPAATPGDWFFHGYCDVNSACRPAFTGIKLRSYPARAGLTSFGYAVANDQLRTQVTALLAELSYRGIVDLDLRRDVRDGQYKLLDFNPRLGAQFRLFRNSDGLDVVLAAYLDLTGQVIPKGNQLSGRGFLVENYDRSGRSATGGAANCGSVPGWRLCGRSTKWPGSPATICAHSA